MAVTYDSISSEDFNNNNFDDTESSTADVSVVGLGGYSTSSTYYTTEQATDDGLGDFPADYTWQATQTNEFGTYGTVIETQTKENPDGTRYDVDLTPADSYGTAGFMVAVNGGVPQIDSGAAFTSTVGGAGQDNRLTIPAYTVDHDGSLAVLFVMTYTDAIAISTITGEGYTERGSLDSDYFVCFTKSVDAGSVSEFTVQTGAGLVGVGNIVIIEPDSSEVTLAVDSATHAHTADNVTVTPVNLTVNDATHSHTADNVTVTVPGSGPSPGAYAIDTTTGGQTFPTTSWATLDTGGTLVDDDSIVTESAGTYTPQEAGYYLIEFESEYEITHNNRCDVEVKIQVNDTDYAGAVGSAYTRNSSNDLGTPDAAAIAYFDGSTDTFRIQHRRDTGSGTPAGSWNATKVKLVLLATGAEGDTPFAHVGTPTSAALSGTTPTAVSGWDSITESDDTVLEHVTGGIRVKETGRPVLVVYGAPTDAAGGSRTGRLSDITLDGTRINHSASHCYQRDSANQYAVLNGMALVEADAVDEDIALRIWGPSDPGWPTVVAGNWTLSAAAGRAGIMAIALPTTLDYAVFEDTTAGQTFSGSATTDLEIFETEVTSGTAFTRSSATEVTTTADDILAYGAYYVQRTSASGTRQSNAVRWEVGGTDQPGKIDYLRGDQSSQDEPDGAYGTLFVGSGGTLNFEKFDPGTDDGANDFTQWGGAFVLDLSTLADAGGGGVDLTVNDASHGHTADNATVSVSVTVDPDDADHAHTADNVTVDASVTVQVDDALHAHTADNATVSVSVTVDPDDADHGHTADNATVSVSVTVDPDDADHGHTADNVTVSADILVVPDDAVHAHTADDAAVSVSVTVDPDDADHGHTADNVTVSADITIAPDDAVHAHTADQATVSVSVTVDPDDADHAHTADNVTVSTDILVIPDDALHAHTADNATVSVSVTVDPDDADHGHTADNVTLDTSVTIEVDDADHGHTADNVTVQAAITVAPDDALHAHAADNATVSVSVDVAPDDALHAHTADQATVTLIVQVDPDDASHGHTAGSPRVSGALEPGTVVLAADSASCDLTVAANTCTVTAAANTCTVTAGTASVTLAVAAATVTLAVVG